ncbi:unnamed protein product [Adineta steineri]|uniref:G-protein coupled receptors family 1 profile domain-containing protein n=1 Tax=Adineta steineri TaxID=433720 RepID=A0A815NUJ1_9BILA|nr:unnamed protein product [Adineta steineri]CAF1441684.1 unnamed protein product [Adineta steineri]CAF3647003.1 unnamed protein product [Adineta steineri]CAF3926217.1 unnamed protein product [Adineta steineri]CAF4029884.1 unnamed protein product [Adineta steineri]
MIPDTVKFWTILVVLIPSLLCTLFLLYHLLFDRNLRNALHNHTITVLLILCLINEMTFYPWMLYYYPNQSVWQRSYMFCLFLGFLDWSLYIAHTLIFAWAMIERHILIFHDQWVSTKRRRFFVHYTPIVVLLLYWFVFYFVVYFFPPCQNRLRPPSLVCIYPCLYDNYILSMWDFFAHQIVPIAIITLCSIGLVIRVLWQKHRMRQMIHWRKYRKMTIQALSIAFLYLIILLPYTIVYIIRNIFFVSNSIINQLYIYTVFLSYFVIPLYPFVCAFSLPELQIKMKNILKLPTTRIMPTT